MKFNKPSLLFASLLFSGAMLAACVADDTPKSVSKDDEAQETGEKQGQQEETKTNFKVGEKVQIGEAALTVTKVDKTSGNAADQSASGKEYIIVHVEIENVGSEKISYNPSDFSIQDSQGQEIETTSASIDPDTALESGELGPGEKRAGTVAFKQPAGDGELTLIYNPEFWSEDEVKIHLE